MNDVWRKDTSFWAGEQCQGAEHLSLPPCSSLDDLSLLHLLSSLALSWHGSPLV
jgi:hypothetical protein